MIGFKTLLARCGRGIPGSGGGETVSSSPLMRPGSGAAMVGDAVAGVAIVLAFETRFSRGADRCGRAGTLVGSAR